MTKKSSNYQTLKTFDFFDFFEDLFESNVRRKLRVSLQTSAWKTTPFVVAFFEILMREISLKLCCVHNMDRLKLIKNNFFKYYFKSIAISKFDVID